MATVRTFGSIASRWAPGFVLGAAVAWSVGVGPAGRPSRALAAPSGPAEAGGTMAFTSASQGSAQWLYLIDTKSQALAVYRIDPQNPKGALKLEAARQYRWDMKLAEFNNASPDVTAVESMVGGARR